MELTCHGCGRRFGVPAGVLEAVCPACGTRAAFTAQATRLPGAVAHLAPEALLGAQIGQWTLTEVIGAGGMGVVYGARQGDTQRALKVLAPALSADTDFVARFSREADALLRLEHPNLIRVYEKGTSVGPDGQTRHYFVMERAHGTDLRALVKQAPVAPALVAKVVRQAALGLSAAHQQGIVHRDVKPANLLLEGDATHPRVKVVDFGVAQLAPSGLSFTSLTRSDLILGTVNYMSPEQRADASLVDARTDIYALGVVAYELLTGRLPLGAFEKPSEVSGVPRAVDKVILTALQREPARRYATVVAFARALDRAVVRRRWPVVAAAAATAGLLMVGGYVFRSEPTELDAKVAADPKVPEAPPAPAVQAEVAWTPPPALLTLQARMLGGLEQLQARWRPPSKKIKLDTKATPSPKAKPASVTKDGLDQLKKSRSE